MNFLQSLLFYSASDYVLIEYFRNVIHIAHCPLSCTPILATQGFYWID